MSSTHINNYSTSSQTINASTTATLIGSTIPIPTNLLQIGTTLRWSIILSKTASGTAANSFIFKLGTAGSTSDASIITFALPVGTAAADSGRIDIIVTIRGPLSASCIAQGHLSMTHNLSATGLATVPCVNIDITSGAFDSTASGLIASIACTTAASTVLTITQIFSESFNL